MRNNQLFHFVHYIKISTILFLSLFIMHLSSYALENNKTDNDTICKTEKHTQFRPSQLIIPTSLIIVGSWGICNGWLQSVNRSIQGGMTDLRKNHSFIHADDYIQYLPVISNLGLEFIGAKAKHSFKDRLIVTATSYVAMGIMVNGVKLAINERRPDSSAMNSFPSGHTATAFMGAELVRVEYGVGYGIGAYAIASSIAFLRLYNNRHWFNDILAGAGVGILSARIGYWLLPINKKLFKMNKKSMSTITAYPFYYYQEKSVGAALSIRF